MKYDYKCTNPKCQNHDITFEITCKLEDRYKQVCAFCLRPLHKQISIVAIKTNDNYKG